MLVDSLLSPTGRRGYQKTKRAEDERRTRGRVVDAADPRRVPDDVFDRDLGPTPPWAHQPTVRLTANVGVNIVRGRPAVSITTPA